ncbi:spherulation-specific family 4 protein [Kitasatospora sp. DSM 101779]|uniref:spherulation-specific family 4 protein n=1 Tax=Kitasatospora sp. DSM 101779 TaxID=2853165 RepID=UPI0021D8B11B|nr:spherulation-specific family 4 protein [Kitasatospora sp. DSM 101779]MCU7826229.1 spherulation-specific family 4 protein [Kitasatospora sp. DSM 101779]
MEERLLVPLYVHPAEDPSAWRALVRAAPRLYGVVVNAADGPGEAPDPVLAEPVAELREAGVRILGYVDTGYGRRPHAAVVEDLQRHRAWYGTDGVYFDQACTDPAFLPYQRRLTVAARALGCESVVLGHGTHPDPAYADGGVADLLVTFEGDWQAYEAAPVPRWTADHPPGLFCHLVHGVPSGRLRAVPREARLRGAAVHYATPGDGDNPWRTLSPALTPALAGPALTPTRTETDP